MTGARLRIQSVPCGQQCRIPANVTLLWCHVFDAAMPMLLVVPAHKLAGPLACCIQIGKAAAWKLRPVRACADER